MKYDYDRLISQLKSKSKDKITSAVYGVWNGPVVIYIFITFLIASFFFFALFDYPVWRVVTSVLCYVILVTIFLSRKMGLGLGEKSFIYFKLGLLPYKPKKIYNIPFKRIRYVSVRRFFSSTNVKMTFISESGKMEKLKFSFNSFIFGRDFKEQKFTSGIIRDKLIELQKEFDRGDF